MSNFDDSVIELILLV